MLLDPDPGESEPEYPTLLGLKNRIPVTVKRYLVCDINLCFN
jgi:hypothetical protein